MPNKIPEGVKNIAEEVQGLIRQAPVLRRFQAMLKQWEVHSLGQVSVKNDWKDRRRKYFERLAKLSDDDPLRTEPDTPPKQGWVWEWDYINTPKAHPERERICGWVPPDLAWSAEPPVERILPLEDRALRLDEKYTLLAAVHDCALKGVDRIAPWRETSIPYVALCHNLVKINGAEHELRTFLEDVKADLLARQRIIQGEPAAGGERQAETLREISKALRKWREQRGPQGRRPEDVPEEERRLAREALVLAVTNLELITSARDRYGCHQAVTAAGVFDKLQTAAAEHDRGADLGGYWCWAEDLTQKHLPGNVSFPDELDRGASRLEREARSDKERPESAMTIKDILEAVKTVMQEAAPPTGTQTTSKVTPLKKPPKIAFVAYALYERMGNQHAVADNLRASFKELAEKGIIDAKHRSTVGQWDVSKWCNAVKEWREVGNAMPSPDEFKPPKTIQTVDPKVLVIGPRGDHRAPRQRATRDPDSIDDED